ncbi:MAG: M48 family metalloprotease [Verrucomicrobia bacterium]|nr:M48 family metalloprotease [Verrucomicrobiota bacterium]
MPARRPRRDRDRQSRLFDDESAQADPSEDPEAARIIKEFQRREQPDVVDAEIEDEVPAAEKDPEARADEARETAQPAERADELSEEQPPGDEAEAKNDAERLAPDETPEAIGPAPEQTTEQRADAKRYHAVHHRLFLAMVGATVAALALFLFLGLSTRLQFFIADRMTANPFAESAFYGIIVTVLYYFIILIPLHYLDFRSEEHFGLTRQTPAGWFYDQFKMMGIHMVVLVAFLVLVYGLLRATPVYWWLWAAGAWTLFVVVATQLTPVLFIPIFYRKEPLHDEDLAERLRHLVERVQMSVVAVEKLGLGAKTVKANAMLAGLGSTKRVLLGDTLLEHFTPDEIETVLAHELGHHYYNHIWKAIAAGAVATFAGFFVASVMLGGLVRALEPTLGFNDVADVATFPILAAALLVMALITMPTTNAFSRALERQADRFALRLTRKPEAFISAMRRLAVRNLADTEPSPIVEALLHTHPSISRRIADAERFREEARTAMWNEGV